MGVAYSKTPACSLNPSLLSGGLAMGGAGVSPNLIVGGGGLALGGIGVNPSLFPGYGGLAFGGTGITPDPPGLVGKGGLAFGGTGVEPSVTIPTPMFWWQFRTGSGLVAFETVAANNGTFGSAITWDADSPTPYFSVINTTDSNGAALIANMIDFSAACSFFFRWKNLGSLGVGNDVGVWNKLNNPLSPWVIDYDWSNGATIRLTIGLGFSNGYDTGAPNTGVWSSFGLTGDGAGSWATYYNGAPANTFSGSGTNFAVPGFLLVGQHTCPSKFTDIRAWQSKLSSSDMAAVHANTTF